MKKNLLLLQLVFLCNCLYAQDFTGQWKGQFVDNSAKFMGFGDERCDYVLELETNGSNVTGYSYTYFNDAGKRYFTICKLTGKLNKSSHYIEVTEIERTKTNVPIQVRNCFQIHKLTFFKKGDEQTLEGSWIPAPNQQGDCGFGTTVLSRRLLKKDTSLFKNPDMAKADKSTNRITSQNKKILPPVTSKTNTTTKPTTKPIVKSKPVIKPAVKSTTTKPTTAPPNATAKTPIKSENKIPETLPPVAKNDISIKPRIDINYQKRTADLLKTIEVEKDTFRVDLYDNGDIDGDSISLFFNGRLLLKHQRLSDKAISLTLNIDNNKSVNELIMYAENLGEIPPNTALMVVTDGNKRYEVRISSDLEKSGVIRFVHKTKPAQ